MTLEQQLRKAAEEARESVVGRRGRPITSLARHSNTARWAMGCAAVALAVVAFVFIPRGNDLTPPVEGTPTTLPETPTTTPETPTTTESTPPTTTSPPGPTQIFPNQVSLPAMVFVNGVIYDLSEVPAKVVLDTGVTSHPYDSPPTMTEHGLLYAVGDLYSGATLVLRTSQPQEGVASQRVISENASSFIISPQGDRIAWAEFTLDSIGMITQTRIVEASFPDLQVLHETTFTGELIESEVTPANATVVTYVENSILLMTGDGALAIAGMWTPGEDDHPYLILPLTTHVTGNTHGSRVVVSLSEVCGTVAHLARRGSNSPGLGFSPDMCIEGYLATFSPDGSMIATTEGGFLWIYSGDGEQLDRLVVEGLSFVHPAIRWESESELLLVGGHRVFRCNTSPLECEMMQEIVFTSTDWNQVALVRKP